MSKSGDKIKAALGISDEKFNPNDYVVVKHGEAYMFPGHRKICEIADATPNQDGTMIVLKKKGT